jgi:hypothetical protein
MSIPTEFLTQLSSLGLTAPQYQAVLSMLARLDTKNEARKERDRLRKLRGNSTEIPQGVSPKEKSNPPSPSEANASERPAAQSMNDFVWLECPKRLQALGLSERASRSNLGRWLKQTKSPERVLAAVEAAERAGTKDPVPYIVEALKPKVLQFGADWEAGAARQVAERERPKISEEERQRNLAKLTNLVSGTLKWNK